MHKQLALALAVLYVITLTAFSLINLGGIPSLGSSFDDKIYHFLAYALFTLLLYNYLNAVSFKNSIFYSILFAVCYGILMEILQNLLTETRVSDFYDVVANFFGIIFGAIGISIYKKLK
uniref:VanZ family protein n=1 Tax=Gelidibacter sp. TaxID=2018083 RepID=UPI00404A25B1